MYGEHLWIVSVCSSWRIFYCSHSGLLFRSCDTSMHWMRFQVSQYKRLLSLRTRIIQNVCCWVCSFKNISTFLRVRWWLSSNRSAQRLVDLWHIWLCFNILHFCVFCTDLNCGFICTFIRKLTWLLDFMTAMNPIFQQLHKAVLVRVGGIREN